MSMAWFLYKAFLLFRAVSVGQPTENTPRVHMYSSACQKRTQNDIQRTAGFTSPCLQLTQQPVSLSPMLLVTANSDEKKKNKLKQYSRNQNNVSEEQLLSISPLCEWSITYFQEVLDSFLFFINLKCSKLQFMFTMFIFA